MRWILFVLLFSFFSTPLAAREPVSISVAKVTEGKYMTSDDAYYDIAGARVRIRQQGPQGAPVLVMLHGFTFSLESWDEWAADLSRDYRVIRYDLLGHGLTGPDPEQRYSPSERAIFLGNVLDALDIDSATIVGNSLGGLVAWKFAVANPDRVDRLILVSPGAYSINGVGEQPVPVPEAFAAYLLLVPEAGLRYSLSRVYTDVSEISAERFKTIYDMMKLPGNGQASIDSLTEFVLPDPSSDLATIKAPVLVLWGAADQVIPAEHGQRIVRDLPSGHLIVYPDTGHVPHEDVWEESLKDVRQFLETTFRGTL